MSVLRDKPLVFCGFKSRLRSIVGELGTGKNRPAYTQIQLITQIIGIALIFSYFLPSKLGYEETASVAQW